MKTRLRALIPILVISSLCGHPSGARSEDITWISTTDSRWDLASNWSLNRVPGAGDHAIIPAGTMGCTNSSVATIERLTVEGVLALRNANLTLTSNGLVSGQIQFVSGTLGGAGELTVSGSLDWTGGTLSDGGRIVLSTGSTNTISGSSSYKYLYRTLENRGWTRQTGTASSYFRVEATGILDNQGIYEIADGSYIGYFSIRGAITNSGRFEKTGTSLVSSVNVPFVNVEGGSIGNLTSAGLNMNVGFSQTGAGSVSTGVVSMTGGTGSLEGTVDGPGVLRLAGGTLNVTSPATVAHLHLDGGTIGGSGVLTISGSLDWTVGSMSAGGRTVLGAGSTNTISGSGSYKNLYRTLENQGSTRQTGTGSSYFRVEGTGILDNQGIYEIADGSYISFSSIRGAITNSGRFEKTGTSLVSSVNVSFVNVDGGSIGNATSAGLNMAYGFSHVGAGSVSTGVVSMTGGTGSLDGTLNGSGTLRLAGGNLNVNNPASVAHLHLVGGTVGGSSVLTVTESLDWTGGDMSAGGRTVLGAGSTNTISGTSTGKYLYRTLENQGWTVQVGTGGSGNSYFYVTGTGVLDNRGTYEIADGSSIIYSTTHGAITNSGLFEKTGTSVVSVINVAFVNADGGAVGNLTASGLEMARGFSQTGAGSISTGVVSMTGGTGSLDGTVEGPGTLRVSGGTLGVTNPSAVAHLHLDGGTVGGPGVLTVSESMDWSGGYFSGTGRTVLGAGSTNTISGSGSSKYLYRTLENQGWTRQVGTGSSYLYVENPGSLDNRGTYEIVDGSSINYGSNRGAITNSGLFEKTGTSVVSSVRVPFANVESGRVGNATSAGLNMEYGFSQIGAGSIGTGVVSVTGGTGSLDGTVEGPGILRLNGGTLNANDPASVAHLQVESGTMGGSGVLTVTGSLDWSGGYFSGTGRTVLGAGSTNTISGSGSSKYLYRTLENQGWTRQVGTGSSYLYVENPGSLDNRGTYEIVDGSSINYGSNRGAITNSGLFEKTGTSVVSSVRVPFVNVESGRVGNATSAGLNMEYGFSQTGAGSICTGVVSVTGGTGSLDGTVEGPGILRLNGGTLNADNPATVAHLEVGSGTVGGSSVLTVSRSLDWTGGYLSGTGRTVLGGGSTNTISGSSTAKYLYRTLENQGWTRQAGTGSSYFYVEGAGTLDNRGTYEIADDSAIHFSSNRGAVTNGGRFEKSGGTGTSAISPPFANASGGVVRVAAGVLNPSYRLVQQGEIDVDEGATFRFGGAFTNQGTIRGRGTIHLTSGSLLNAGTVAPGSSPGILTIDGNFTQSGTGALNMELGGADAGTGYDRLAISGAASLGGTLNVSLTNGYTPAPGTVYVLLTHGSRSGAFASTNLPVIADGSQWGGYQSASVWQLYREPIQTAGGVPTVWYRERGVGPADDEAWTQEQWDALDGQDLDADGDVNAREYLADTDPLASNDWFHVTGLNVQPPVNLSFNSSSNRLYTLQATPSLSGDSWEGVPGQGPRPGVGGPDAMVDTNAPSRRFYRLRVELP